MLNSAQTSPSLNHLFYLSSYSKNELNSAIVNITSPEELLSISKASNTPSSVSCAFLTFSRVISIYHAMQLILQVQFRVHFSHFHVSSQFITRCNLYCHVIIWPVRIATPYKAYTLLIKGVLGVRYLCLNNFKMVYA